MTLLVNSDNKTAVDVKLMDIVESRVHRALGRFTVRLTRVEVHLSDVATRKVGPKEKRCLVEVRPKGTQPMSASAKATTLPAAIDGALGKMQRLLTTFFGRRERLAAVAAAATPAPKKKVIEEATDGVRKTAADRKPKKLSPRGPKKKGIYQARRKSWPR